MSTYCITNCEFVIVNDRSHSHLFIEFIVIRRLSLTFSFYNDVMRHHELYEITMFAVSLEYFITIRDLYL